MKTTTFNAAKEIRTGILLIVFTMAIFTAFKLKDLQLNEADNAVMTSSGRSAMNHAHISSSPILDARLIEEPALEIETWMNSDSFWGAKTESEVIEAEPALQVEAWMMTASYWKGDAATIKENGPAEIVSPLAIE